MESRHNGNGRTNAIHKQKRRMDMTDAVKTNSQGQADQRPATESLTNEKIEEGFELLRLGHLGQRPFTTPDDFARSFERCSILKKGRIKFATDTGV